MKGTDQSTYPGNWKVQNRSSGPWHCSLLPGLCTDGHWRLFLFQSEGHILSLSLASANSFCLLVYSLSIFFFLFFKTLDTLFICSRYCFFLFFWPHCVAHGILVTQPGIKPVPPAVEVGSLHHWISREVPSLSISTNTVSQEGRKTWTSSLLFSE